MCGTCGCGNNEGGISIFLPGEKKQSLEQTLINNHDHHHHDHHHDHHHSNGHTHHHNHKHSRSIIEVEQDILNENALMAARNRGYFEAKNILVFNLVSSPGSGKTTILEKTLAALKDRFDIYVIEGDQQTSNDADRIAKLNVPVVQINTGSACHLDASMVNTAIKKLNPKDNSILFIENVGNLVCPAMFDLGEYSRIVIMSTTEGDDKAIKYPDMFHTSNLCLINKIDLSPYVNFDIEAAKEYAKKVNHHLEFIEMSATDGSGMEDWYAWISNLHATV